MVLIPPDELGSLEGTQSERMTRRLPDQLTFAKDAVPGVKGVRLPLGWSRWVKETTLSISATGGEIGVAPHDAFGR